MPEFKSLLLGLIFALGIFSVKSGCGVSVPCFHADFFPR